MKQLLQLSLLVLLSVVSFHSHAIRMDDEEIDLEPVKNQDIKPRSVVIMPQAWFSSQTSTVTLQISSQDGYAIVTIKDNMGVDICSQSALANGTMQQISLPNYPSTGTYYISIECSGAEYTGNFNYN